MDPKTVGLLIKRTTKMGPRIYRNPQIDIPTFRNPMSLVTALLPLALMAVATVAVLTFLGLFGATAEGIDAEPLDLHTAKGHKSLRPPQVPARFPEEICSHARACCGYNPPM